MSSRSFSIVLFALSALSVAHAQDPTKTEPTHYKLAFENEYVQVVNVHYGAHEKWNSDAHPGGVVCVQTSGHVKFTDEHGNTREVHAMPGESRWFPPLRHKVENLGDSPYDAVYIGIKGYRKTTSGHGGQPVMDAQTKALVARALAVTQR